MEKENFEAIPSRDGLSHDTTNGLDVPKIHDLNIEDMYFVTTYQMHKELEGVGHRQPSPNIIVSLPFKCMVKLFYTLASHIFLEFFIQVATHSNNPTIVFAHA